MTDVATDQLFSRHVVLVDSRARATDDSLLWPEEREALGEVVPGRWWDWVTGRRCARLALSDLGVEPAPVLRGPKRAEDRGLAPVRGEFRDPAVDLVADVLGEPAHRSAPQSTMPREPTATTSTGPPP